MSEPIRRLVSKVLDLNCWSRRCWNRRLSETQRILNYARSRPPIAKAISVLRLLSAATSWLFLWGIITALVELFIVETVSLGPRFGLMTTVVAPLVALPMAIWIALFKPRKRQPTQCMDKAPREEDQSSFSHYCRVASCGTNDDSHNHGAPLPRWRR